MVITMVRLQTEKLVRPIERNLAVRALPVRETQGHLSALQGKPPSERILF